MSIYTVSTSQANLLPIRLIPIASIITPATLSVTLLENLASVRLQHTPQIDFDSLNFVAGMPAIIGYNGASLYYTYNGPSQIVQHTAIGAAAQNQILPIEAPHPNSTWSMDFHGPALRCEPLSTDQQLKFTQNIAQHVQGENCRSPPTYLAWFPRLFNESSNATYTEPYLQSSNHSTWQDSDSIFKPGLVFDNGIIQEATLYITVMPQMLDLSYFTQSSKPLACNIRAPPIVNDKPLEPVGGNITMIKCKLHNTTYNANFSYINGKQNVKVNVTRNPSDPTVPVIANVRGSGTGGRGSSKNCSTLNTEPGRGKPCFFDRSLLSQLSYQGILHAFSLLVTGNITLDDRTTKGPSDASRIRTTGLVNTKELRYLTDYGLHTSSRKHEPDLQQSLLNSNMSAMSGLARLKPAAGETSLQGAIEEMFQNFTVSLMASSELQ